MTVAATGHPTTVYGPDHEFLSPSAPENIADKRYFRRRAHRKHYVRRPFPNELRIEAEIGRPACAPEHFVPFVAVKKDGPTSILRMTVYAPPEAETDLSEADARHVFDGYVRAALLQRVQAPEGGAR